MSNTYEAGISNVKLFIAGTGTGYSNGYKTTGVDWIGVTSVSESPEGGEPTSIYADNVKYLDIMSNEQIKATIEAYQYPTDFEVCDGTVDVNGVHVSQQDRTMFCLAYQTEVGNENGIGTRTKYHYLYNCLASPADRQYQTINESADAQTFSWSISTTPITDSTWFPTISGVTFKPTSLIVVDSNDLSTTQLTNLTAAWGTFKTPAALYTTIGST